MKPKLVDYSLFVEKKVSVKPQKINQPKVIQSNDFSFLINIIIVLIIFIGGYLLYKRYKNKDENNKIYTKKIENLYNTINKTNG
tara:strand:- start:3080 stop:3331 length:252 start_codon:yes stop_codon:yes gene_type:complete